MMVALPLGKSLGNTPIHSWWEAIAFNNPQDKNKAMGVVLGVAKILKEPPPPPPLIVDLLLRLEQKGQAKITEV